MGSCQDIVFREVADVLLPASLVLDTDWKVISERKTSCMGNGSDSRVGTRESLWVDIVKLGSQPIVIGVSDMRWVLLLPMSPSLYAP
jgi:hypothetical protein